MYRKTLFLFLCFLHPIFSMESSSEEEPYYIEGLELLQKDKMPKHIAFIMDGNRRWAKRQNLPETDGHTKGADTVVRLLKFLYYSDLDIDTVTLYAFSTENWKRSEYEIHSLMDLFLSYLDEIAPCLKRYSIRLQTIGDLTRLPIALQEKIQEVKDFPIEKPKYTLVMALNYGSRDEIKRAFTKMAQDIEKGVFSSDDVSERLIASYLDTSFSNDPELIIRTSGELRLSNFLLWQAAYSELYFSSVLWPDFSEQELVRILLEFQQRERRFGGKI